MIEISAHWDIEDILDGFDDMKRQARNLSSVWRELAPDLKKDVAEHGKKKEGPGGKWPRLASSTRKKRAARKRQGRRTAKATLGKLRTAFTVEWGPKFIRARSKVPWSLAHEEGAVVGKGSRLPARPMFYFSESFLEKARDRILKKITRRF